MGGELLDWGKLDPKDRAAWDNHVCVQDGTITYMFGGYGHYYKVTWRIGGQNGYATGTSIESITKAVNTKLLGFTG